jgi:prephenate dehydrogenase
VEDVDFSNLVISVVGLGVIGGSFAMALQQVKPGKLYGIDKDKGVLKKAEEMGIIDKGYTDASIPLKRSDIVIICIYPRQIYGFMKQNMNNFKLGAIVTDSAGVKIKLAGRLQDILPPDIDFIFGHPMAGREKKGIDYASGTVFQGANYIITPMPYNKEDNIRFIENLMIKIGFKRVSRISCAEHDRFISYTSQLPHAIAVALVNSDEYQEDIGLFIGDSYRELTRIAKINEELWAELFLENGDNLVKQIEMFESKLEEIKTFVLKKDRDALINCFKKACKRREAID